MLQVLDDDSLESVARHLEASSVELLRTACTRMRRVASRDSIWRGLAERRWAKRRQCAEWLAAASNWRDSYADREKEIRRKAVPVFAMSARLSRQRICSLHFFEPRYKWLIRRAVDDHASHFVFCTRSPHTGPNSSTYSWLCEARAVQFLPDGSANLGAYPVARCALERIWYEHVPDMPPTTPQLAVADIAEIADFDPDPASGDRRQHDHHNFETVRRARLSDQHRTLLELLITHPHDMRDLLTEDRILELLLLDDRLEGILHADDAMDTN